MPLILIISPGHPLPEPVRAVLAKLEQPYAIECWARGRWYCPFCASCANLAGAQEGAKAECWGCFTDCYCRLTDSGECVSSTDDPAKRK